MQRFHSFALILLLASSVVTVAAEPTPAASEVTAVDAAKVDAVAPAGAEAAVSAKDAAAAPAQPDTSVPAPEAAAPEVIKESAPEVIKESAPAVAEEIAPATGVEAPAPKSEPAGAVAAETVASESVAKESVAKEAVVEEPEPREPAAEQPAETGEASADQTPATPDSLPPVVEAEQTPAPIVEPAPPQRAENVDLREVVTEKVALPPVVTVEPAARTESTPAPVDEVVPEGTPLILLGTEVPPSTAARLAWSPSESFAGIDAPTPVLVVNGAKPGPVLCLTAAIHGDELVGIEIVRRVLYSVDAKQLSGALIGVPIVNLQGFRRGSRYLQDRRDLNRYFPGNTYGSSASRIAYSFFNEIVTRCDLLVDLHTGSFHRANMPQVRGDLQNPDVAALTKGFGGTVILHGRGARGMLRRAAVEAGIPAVTLEAGEPLRLDDGPVEHGVRSIESLLDSLGMLKTRTLWSRREQPIFYKSTWVRANEGGVLNSKVRLGQRIKVGDLLGTVIDPITNAQHDIISPYAGRIIGMAVNQVMMPGFAAYHVGIEATVEEAAEPDPTLDTAIDELDDEDAEPMPESPAQSGEQSSADPIPVEEASTGE